MPERCTKMSYIWFKYLIYAWQMFEIFLRHASFMPNYMDKIRLRNAWYILKIYLRLVWEMAEISLWYTWDNMTALGNSQIAYQS